MTRICTACGVTPVQPEPPVPPKGTGTLLPPSEPETCPNCGKAGTMQDVVDLPSGEEEEE